MIDGLGALADGAADGREKEVTRLGHAAADDDGIGVQEPDDVDEGGTDLDPDGVPQAERDSLAAPGGFGEGERGAVLRRHLASGGAIELRGAGGDLVVADVFFEAAGVAVGPGEAAVVDARVPDFAGGELRPAVDPAIEDEGSAHAGAERDAEDVAAIPRGPVLPLAVSHRSSVVLDDRGQAGALDEERTQRHFAPAGDVREGVDDAVHAIHEARQTHAHGNNFRMGRAQDRDDAEYLGEERVGLREKLGVNDRAVRQHASVLDDGGLDRGAAEVDADGWARGLHEGGRHCGSKGRAVNARVGKRLASGAGVFSIQFSVPTRTPNAAY